MKKKLKKISDYLLMGLMLALPSAAIAQQINEDTAKAAFTIKFMQYIEWPEGTKNSFEICVIGSSPVASKKELFEELSTSSIKYTLSEVKSVKGVLSHCDVLFISESEDSRLEEILSTVKEYPLVTMSDIEDFAERGGMIEFLVRDNRMRFKINTKAARTANLRISGKALELALDRIDK